jgi:hypothetical protein
MANSRPFHDFLREHRNGATHDDLSDALQELVAAVVTEGKAGKLTITIAVKPMGRESGALEVSTDIKLAPPKSPPGASVFFASPENNLIRQDPRQTSMELREIGPATLHKGVA